MRTFFAVRAAQFLGAVILLVGAGAAIAQEEPSRFAGGAGFDVTSDSDGFRTYRARVGGAYAYQNPWSYSGVAVQSTRYSQDGFQQDVPAVLGTYRDQRRDNLVGVDIQAGVARVSGHLRPIGDASYRFMPSNTTSVDFLASADLVESPEALRRGIGYGFFAVGVEQDLTDRFAVTAYAGYQPFSDGNARTHFRGRLIWTALPEQGVSLQLRYRQYATRDLDVDNAYFNPERYRQWLAVAALRHRYAGWMFTGALGAGQERATGSGSQGSYLAEVRAEGPFAGDSRLIFHAGYYRAAGFIDFDGYAYRSIGAEVVVPF
ncbi:hypothetical protein BWI17_21330 [Betaproteobacteria bacterium GR16-43]|nr:hypothetical protein BWI17_21330 [Betaproteobacteria bacterium GR16-43]